MSSRVFVVSRTSQVQHSYLEISNFIREYIATSQKYGRQHRRVFHAATSTTKSFSPSTVRCQYASQRHKYSKVSSVTRQKSFFSVSNQQARAQNEEDLRIVESFEKATSATTFSSDGWQELRNWQSTIKEQKDEKKIQLYGYITSQRPVRGISFVQLIDPSLQQGIQLVCSDPKSQALNTGASSLSEEKKPWKDILQYLHPHTPVSVTGRVVERWQKSKDTNNTSPFQETLDLSVGKVELFQQVEVQVESIQQLNSFESTIDARHEILIPPEQRHLAFRTSHLLRERIHFRSRLRSLLEQHLECKGFEQIETPILFKSTPEGAREYVVPTRYQGLAYALPQSPQQYKQILMASGIPKYFQFARCFRDEDLRSDRQPEFTQLDLEVAFADSKAVMLVIEDLVLNTIWPLADRWQRLDPTFLASLESPAQKDTLLLPIMTYEEAMTKYGSDKPDTRIGSEIHRIEDWIPSDLKGMLSSLENPIVEMIVVSMEGSSPSESRRLLTQFMKLPASAQYSSNPEGMPGISVYDPTAPMRGLASFGFEAAEKVEEVFEPEPGDVFIIQSRKNKPFSGGATMLGRIRQQLHQYCVQQGIRDQPEHDSLLWVVDFPLFSPVEESSPGQGGMAGICSTHHPFTAPKPGQELQRIIDDPLSVIGDHYDLVINGTEIGGGSRRIHHRQMQELIFKKVLQMDEGRVKDFEHLLNALQSGCPPHAGFALGFDRLVALLADVESVRDVIAFPKYKDGKDLLVGSPSELTPSQLATYHLSIKSGGTEVVEEPRLSIKA